MPIDQSVVSRRNVVLGLASGITLSVSQEARALLHDGGCDPIEWPDSLGGAYKDWLAGCAFIYGEVATEVGEWVLLGGGLLGFVVPWAGIGIGGLGFNLKVVGALAGAYYDGLHSLTCRLTGENTQALQSSGASDYLDGWVPSFEGARLSDSLDAGASALELDAANAIEVALRGFGGYLGSMDQLASIQQDPNHSDDEVLDAVKRVESSLTAWEVGVESWEAVREEFLEWVANGRLEDHDVDTGLKELKHLDLGSGFLEQGFDAALASVQAVEADLPNTLLDSFRTLSVRSALEVAETRKTVKALRKEVDRSIADVPFSDLDLIQVLRTNLAQCEEPK